MKRSLHRFLALSVVITAAGCASQPGTVGQTTVGQVAGSATPSAIRTGSPGARPNRQPASVQVVQPGEDTVDSIAASLKVTMGPADQVAIGPAPDVSNELRGLPRPVDSVHDMGGRRVTRSVVLSRALPPCPSSGSAEPPGRDFHVRFASGSDMLTRETREWLAKLGWAAARGTCAYRFRIEGHTDSVGSHSYNRWLSERRAASVARFLEMEFGIARWRLETVGFGEESPLVLSEDETDEPANRRVRVVNLDG